MENELRSKYKHEYPVNLKQTSPYNVVNFFVVVFLFSILSGLFK